MTSTYNVDSQGSDTKCTNGSCDSKCPHVELARQWSSRFSSERPRNKAFLDRAAEDFAGRAICEEGQALVQRIFVDWLAGYDKPFSTYITRKNVSASVLDTTGSVLISGPRYFRIHRRFDKVNGEKFVGCSWETLLDRSKRFLQGNTPEPSTTEPSRGSQMTADTGANENPSLSDSSEASSINSQNQTFFSSLWNSVTGYK